MVAGLTLFMAPAAFAEPLTFSGDVSAKFQRDTEDGADDTSGMIYTFRLNGVADLGSGWSLYTRFGAQYAHEPSQSDFNPDSYDSGKKGVMALDQFGFTYQAEKMTYKLGRQVVAVGTTALLYSRPDSNIGKEVFVDGLSFSGTVGAMDISGILAREDNAGSEDKNNLYAVRAGYSPSENFNWGVTLGRYHYTDGGNTNHWAVDSTYKLDKSAWTVEYTQSNRSDDNRAYAATWNYDFNDKTGAYITAFRVEPNGDMGGQSDFDNGYRGFKYGVTHQLQENDSLEVVFTDQKEIDSRLRNTSLEVTLSHAF